MIKMWVFFHYEIQILLTSYKINTEVNDFENKIIYNDSGKIFAYFPEIDDLINSTGKKSIYLNNKNKILFDTNDIHISNHNILFKFDKNFIKKNFQITTIREIFEVMDSNSEELKPEYIVSVLNNLSMNQKIEFLEKYFYTNNSYLRVKLENFFILPQAPEMKKEVKLFSFQPHQKEGLVFLNKNHKNQRATCFSYQMGAGKTRMIIYFLYGLSGKTMIVLKSSLIIGMLKEMKEIGIRSILDFHVITTEEELKDYKGNNCVISYEFLSRYKGNYSETLWHLQFDYAVCDEAQTIENPKSNVFKNLINLSIYRFAFFSGTLLRNEVANSYYISYFAKFFIGSYEEYQEGIQANAELRKTHALNKNSEFAVEIRRKILEITTSYINKFKFEINEYFLPVKLRQEEMLCYSKELEEAYRIVKEINEFGDEDLKKKDAYAIRRHKISEILAKIPRMIAIASNYKLIDTLYKPTIDAVLFNQDILPSKFLLLKALLKKHKFEKVLVFCSTKNIGISYHEMLIRHGIKNYYVDGGVSKEERFRLIDEFNNPDNNKNVFIAIREAMKYGFNFKNTSVIINLDTSWTPADNEQANARIKRLSQVNSSVTIYNIFSVATIDEYMKNTVRFKNNALKDFWVEDSDYDVTNDYSSNYLSLVRLISSLYENKFLSNVKETPIENITEDINFSDVEKFLVKCESI